MSEVNKIIELTEKIKLLALKMCSVNRGRLNRELSNEEYISLIAYLEDAINSDERLLESISFFFSFLDSMMNDVGLHLFSPKEFTKH